MYSHIHKIIFILFLPGKYVLISKIPFPLSSFVIELKAAIASPSTCLSHTPRPHHDRLGSIYEMSAQNREHIRTVVPTNFTCMARTISNCLIDQVCISR